MRHVQEEAFSSRSLRRSSRIGTVTRLAAVGALLALTACNVSEEIDPVSAGDAYAPIPYAPVTTAARATRTIARVQLASAEEGPAFEPASGRHVTYIARRAPVLHDVVGGLCPWSHGPLSRSDTAYLIQRPMAGRRPLL